MVGAPSQESDVRKVLLFVFAIAVPLLLSGC